MTEARFYIIAAIILLAVSFAGQTIFARGNKDKDTESKIVQVTGIVRLVGTGILPEIVISNEEGEWYIVSNEKDKLYDLQHRTVTVEGNETVIQLTFAGGLPAGNRYELSNVKILHYGNIQ